MLSKQADAHRALLSVADAHELSIRLWSDGLTFLQEEQPGQSQAKAQYQYLPFDKGHADYATAAKELFFRHELLTLPYKSVTIYYQAKSFVLVPQALYEEGRGDYWLRCAVMPPADHEQLVLDWALPNQDKVLLLDWDKTLHDFIRRTHLASKFVPTAAALLQENERQSRLQPGNCVAVQICRSAIEIFVFNGGQLRFANSFSLCSNVESALQDELLFYLMSVWNSLELNAETELLKIYLPPKFEIDVERELIRRTLNPFFKQVEFKDQEQA